MTYDPTSDLAAAMQEVTITQAAKLLGLGEIKVGANKSPFREDKSPSFSVYVAKDGTQRYKDWATEDHGGLWKFVALACPTWPKAEVAKWIITTSGRQPGTGKSRGWKAAAARATADAEQAIDKGRLEELHRLPAIEHTPAWPDFVRERYLEGWFHLKDEAELDRIAEQRGFLNPDLAEIHRQGLIARPLVPWSDTTRGVAFPVAKPSFTDRRDHPTLDIVGYHQRWTRDGIKSWLYVPHIPTKSHGRFQQNLAKLAGKVHPYPYVMGNLNRPGLVVITEGQWDAIALAIAAKDVLADAAIFGLRGASSISVFIGAYGAWLKLIRPKILLLADADDAGRRWLRAESPGPGYWPDWSFVDRLKALEPQALATAFLARKSWGKDFNDYYRHAMPEPQDIAKWLRKMRLE